MNTNQYAMQALTSEKKGRKVLLPYSGTPLWVRHYAVQ